MTNQQVSNLMKGIVQAIRTLDESAYELDGILGFKHTFTHKRNRDYTADIQYLWNTPAVRLLIKLHSNKRYQFDKVQVCFRHPYYKNQANLFGGYHVSVKKWSIDDPALIANIATIVAPAYAAP